MVEEYNLQTMYSGRMVIEGIVGHHTEEDDEDKQHAHIEA